MVASILVAVFIIGSSSAWAVSPPVQSNWSPANGACIGTINPTVTFTTDKNSTCRWDLTDLGYAAMPGGNTCSGASTTGQSCSVLSMVPTPDILYLSCRGDDASENTNADNTALSYSIDLVAPSNVTAVLDGLGADIDVVASSSQLEANWTDSTDSGCGVYRYWYAVGTTPGATNTVDWTERTLVGASETITGLTLSEGTTYYISVKAKDMAGNFSSVLTSDGQTVDLSPPTQSAWNPAKTSVVVTNAPTITFTTNENATCRWSLSDSSYASMPGGNTCSGSGTTSQSCSVSGMTEGLDYVYVSCVDTVGNDDTAGTNEHIDLIVDQALPTQSLWSPISGSTITTTFKTITFTVSENSDCKWSLTDQAYGAMTGDCIGDGTTSISCSATGLSEGANTVYLACRDAAGSSDTAGTNTPISYIVDTQPPTQSAWSPAAPSSISTSTRTFTFMLNEIGDCRWSLTDQSFLSMTNDCTGDGTTSISCDLSGYPEGSNKYYYFACRDSVSNSDSVASNTGHGPFTVAYTPPTQSAWNPTNPSWLGSASFTTTFTTNKNATCRWATTDLGYSAMPPANVCAGANSTSHTCSISGMAESVSPYNPNLFYSCLGDDATENTSGNNYEMTYKIDLTAPSTVVAVYDSLSGDVDFSTSTTQLTANWTASTDSASGLANYYYSIGTTPGASNTVSWTSKSAVASNVTVSSLALAEGATYYFSVKAMDSVGNFSAAVNSDGITIDTTPPTQSAWNPASGLEVPSSSPSIAFTTNEAATCRWSLTDQSYSAMSALNVCGGAGTTSQTCATSGLAEGTNNLYVACSDNLDNANSAANNQLLTYIVDQLWPTQSAWNPASGSGFTTTSTTTTFTMNEPSDCKWSLSDLAYGAMTGDCTGDGTTSISCSITGMAEGANTVSFSCRDQALNTDTAGTNSSVAYTVDTQKPVQSLWSPAAASLLTTADPTITFTTDENASCRWATLDNAYTTMVNDCAGGGSTGHTCSVTSLSQGAVTVYIACRDTIGNMDTVGTNKHLAYTVDSLPPTQSSRNPAAASYIPSTSKTVTFTTNETADCKWALSDLDYDSMTGDCSGDGTTSQSCVVSSYPASAITVSFSCRDANGTKDSAATNDDIAYTSDATPPTSVSPVNDGASADVDYITVNNQLVANWTASTDSGAGLPTNRYYYSIGTSAGASDTVNWTLKSGTSTNTSVSLALAEGATYYFTVKSVDNVGNSSAPVSSDGVIVDTLPPGQSNWSPAKGSTLVATTASITFDTDENADCKWHIYDWPYVSMTSACSGSTTTHTCNATGLVEGPNSVYISCTDGRVPDTAGTNELVDYIVDLELPTQSAWNPANNASFNTSSRDVTLTMNEPSDCKWTVGADMAYAAMAGDCSGDATKNITCSISGLVEGANSVHIACSDVSGHQQDATSNKDLTYTLDTVLPTQSGWSPVAGTTFNTSSSAVAFTTNENADCKWSLSDVAYGSMGGDCSGDGGTSMSCTVTGYPEGAVTVYLGCQDTAGNRDTSLSNIEIGYIIDTTKPTQSNWSPAKSASIATTSPTITLDTNENADCKWSLTDQTYAVMTGDCSGDGTTAQSCATSGLVEGAEIVYIACRDTIGNADNVTSNTHVDYTVDVTPPTPSTWNPAKGTTLSSSSQTITFTTNETADCKWSLADDAYSAMAGDCAGDGSTAQSCAASGLVEGAEIVYISCRDALLNEDSAGTNEHVDYTVDVSPPTQSAWSPAASSYITTSPKTITFTTNEVADCKWSLTDQSYAAMAGDCSGDGTTSQSCSVSGYGEGAITVSLSCNDARGINDTAGTNDDLAYTVDTVPPTQSAWNPAAGSVITSSSQTITLTTSENADCKWSLTDQDYSAMTGDCAGDGTTSQSCAVTGMPDGAVVVSIACRDANGASDSVVTNDDLSYTVDTAPPVQSAWSPASGSSFTTSTRTVTFTTNENADCRWALTDLAYSAMINDCAGDGTTSISCDITGMAEGSNTVSLSCNDTRGNSDSAATNDDIVYSVDTTPPTQSAWSPANGGTITTLSPTATFTTNENADCKWSLSDQSYAAMTGDCAGDGTTSQSCAMSGLAEGANSLYFACNDSKGNADTAGTNSTVSVTVDTTTPTQSAWSPAGGSTLNTTARTIFFTTNENADCKWSLTDQAYGSMTGDCLGDGTTSQSCNATGLPQGAATVYIACRDTAGNQDSAASNQALSYTIDSLPPVQSAWIPASGSTLVANTQIVTFATDESADCKWALTDLAYGSMTGDCAGDGTTSQSCSTTGLVEGANTVSISCRDTNANADTNSTNDDISYTVDTLAPTRSAWSPASGTVITATSKIVTFTTNENASCRWATSAANYSAMTNNCSGSGTTSQSCSTTGLVEGANTLYFACADSHGNADLAAACSTLPLTVDTIAPTQSVWAPATGTVISSSVAITFTTGEAASCKWSLSDLAYSSMTGDCAGDGTTSQSCSATGLADGSTTIYIACADLAGNQDTIATNTSGAYTVDASKPVQSAWSPTNGSVVLSAAPNIYFNTNEIAYCRWALTDLSYGNMINGCDGDGTIAHTCASTGLPEGAVTIYIACADLNGNDDSASTNTALSYTIDTIAPIQSGWSPADMSWSTTASPTVTFATAENATCKWSMLDEGYASMFGACSGGGTKSQSCGVTGLPQGTSTVYIGCADPNGNSTQAGAATSLTYKVDTIMPVASDWSPVAGTLIGGTSVDVSFVTSEEVACKWSLTDVAYSGMSGSCSANALSQTCQAMGLPLGASSTVYVACSDPAGNAHSDTTNYELEYKTVDLKTTISMKKGWNLVGISRDNVSINVTSSFSGKVYDIYSVTNGGGLENQSKMTTLAPTGGSGYWIYADSDFSVTTNGEDESSLFIILTLQPGWNLISTPYKTHTMWGGSSTRIECGTQTGQFPSIFTYEDDGSGGEYKEIVPGVDSILPWNGYLIRASNTETCYLKICIVACMPPPPGGYF